VRHDRYEGDEALAAVRGAHPVTTLLLVMAAGAIGVALRFGLDALVTDRAGDSFPWSTLAVNVIGAFAMGVLVAVLDRGVLASVDAARPVLGIGLLGGFTTYSAFALDTVALAEDGRLGRAVTYVAATNLLGIGALVAGLAAGRSGG
jgi:CrcB protein